MNTADLHYLKKELVVEVHEASRGLGRLAFGF